MSTIKIYLLTFFLISNSAIAASFDCSKASTAHEKLICSNPELNDADEKMGEAYKLTSKNFPVKGFIRLSQRRFLMDYRACNSENVNKNEGISRCVAMARERTQVLISLRNSNVYTNNPNAFTHDDTLISISSNSNKPILRYWGNWMPDAYDQKPFPYGFLCDDYLDLKISNGSMVSTDSDIKILVGEKSVKIDAIHCSARQGPIKGEFQRVK